MNIMGNLIVTYIHMVKKDVHRGIFLMYIHAAAALVCEQMKLFHKF